MWKCVIMNKKKIMIVIGIIIFIFIVSIFFYCLFRNDEIERLDINDSDKYEVNDRADNVSDISNGDEDSINDVNDSDLILDTDDSTNVTSSEEDVVNYFEEIYAKEENGNLDNFKSDLKDGFIKIVDFIFYDSEINGYTFKELGNIAKLKIIGIALKLDGKIEEYIPNYKETISSTSGKVYNDVKERLVILYLDISSSVCSNHQDGCATAKEIFSEVKNKCKIGWDFVKRLLASGSGKLKDWYEVYSGK